MPDKLSEAIVLIRCGDKHAGFERLLEVLNDDPQDDLAWVWMSAAVDTDERRRECLDEALQINPDNVLAKRAMTKLNKRHGELVSSQVSTALAHESTRASAFQGEAQPTDEPLGKNDDWVLVPVFEGDQASGSAESPAERKLALRAGALILVANAMVALLMGALLVLEGISTRLLVTVAPVPVDGLLALSLLRGQGDRWTKLAIVRGVLGVLMYALLTIAGQPTLGLVAAVALCGALVFALAGKSRRLKTMIAILMGAVGYGAIFIELLLIVFPDMF